MGPAGVDLDLLSGVVKGVESELDARQVKLSSDKKARVIVLLYEYFSKTGQAVTVEKIGEYLSLVTE